MKDIVVSKSDKYKFFVGLVCVHMYSDYGTQINQHNDTFHGWYVSENEALGHFVKIASRKFPQGSIVFSAAYDVTEAAEKNPNVKSNP